MAGDDELMKAVKETLDNMSDAEKAQRAQVLKKRLDEELNRRKMAALKNKKK